jgi:hypothetical protein
VSGLAKPSADASKSANPAARDTRRYIPSGAFTRAILLGGLDAPTGGQSQRNPQPVLLRLVDHAMLPNQFRARHQGMLRGRRRVWRRESSERAYIRTESLSCVMRDGSAIDVADEGLCGRRGWQGRNAWTPGIQAGPDCWRMRCSPESPAVLATPSNRARPPMSDIAARCDHRHARSGAGQAIREPASEPASASATGSPRAVLHQRSPSGSFR